MSSNTPNYNLIKPDPSDFYNIADFNNNADKVDTALGQKLDTSNFKNTLDTHKSTTAQAQAGTVDNSYMTPLKVIQALSVFGFGGNTSRSLNSGSYNDVTVGGIYAVGSTVTDGPSSSTSTLLHMPRTSNSAVQIDVTNSSNTVNIRSFAGGAWSAWDMVSSTSRIGVLSSLQTTAKNTLVAAINEIVSTKISNSDRATTSEAQAGVNDLKYMTPLKTFEVLSSQVNSLGIGGQVSTSLFTDYNLLRLGGVYKMSNSSDNRPEDSSCLVFITSSSDTSISQLAVSEISGIMYLRNNISGVWGSWKRVTDSSILGNLNSLSTSEKSTIVGAINEVVNTSINASNKSSTSQAQAGTNDNTFMTPLKSKQQLEYNASIRRGTLNSSDDLNNIYAAGMYALSSDSTPSNMPVGSSGYGTLIVSRGVLNDTSSMTSQIYLSHANPPAMFFRTASTSSWRAWTRLITTNESGDISALQTAVKTNLVAAINSAYVESLKLNAKASTAQAQAGTNDDNYMTPLKTKQHLDYSITGLKATESQAKAGTSNDALMTPLRVNNVTGTLTNLQTTDKSSLVAAINENFTRVVNGKGLIATAINDMGGNASGSDSFQELADDIREIVPKYASGTIAVSAPLTPYSYYDASGTESMPSVIVSGLTFQPSRIVIIGTGGISRITEYDFELGALSESIRCSAYTGNRRDSGATYHFKNTGNAYVTETGFKLPLISGSDNATWYAYE